LTKIVKFGTVLAVIFLSIVQELHKYCGLSLFYRHIVYAC